MQIFNEINNNIINEIIYLINTNYFHNIHTLLLEDEQKQKELTFLQRKREDDHFKLRIENDFVFQKGINFSISNSNEKIGNIEQKNESRITRSDSQPYLSNFRVKSSDNPNLKESNKININKDNMKTNSINSINNNPFKKIKYFNIIKNINRNVYLIQIIIMKLRF